MMETRIIAGERPQTPVGPTDHSAGAEPSQQRSLPVQPLTWLPLHMWSGWVPLGNRALEALGQLALDCGVRGYLSPACYLLHLPIPIPVPLPRCTEGQCWTLICDVPSRARTQGWE